MTPEHCDREVARLHILRGMPEDVVEYFAALKDVPDDRFTLAVSHALRTRMWFPTPAELRADVDATAPTTPPEPVAKVQALVGSGLEVVLKNPFTGTELSLKVTRIWKFDCDDCADSGWRSSQCPEHHCGRRLDHAPHEWVERCHCLEHNPTIRRRKDAAARYAQPAEKVHS